MLQGIGKGIGRRIADWLGEQDLGSRQARKEPIENTEIRTAISEIQRINGIGPAKARTLVLDHGVRSVEDLKQEHIFKSLTAMQRLSIQYGEETQKHVMREEITNYLDVRVVHLVLNAPSLIHS